MLTAITWGNGSFRTIEINNLRYWFSSFIPHMKHEYASMVVIEDDDNVDVDNLPTVSLTFYDINDLVKFRDAITDHIESLQKAQKFMQTGEWDNNFGSSASQQKEETSEDK